MPPLDDLSFVKELRADVLYTRRNQGVNVVVNKLDFLRLVAIAERASTEAPSRLATEGRALPYMGRRRWGQELTGSR